ncbi:MAG TPA: GNAT family protein [Thermomicrobiales bacterium]|nr:GNAT family protein [Thermomicrobiales bacterium]
MTSDVDDPIINIAGERVALGPLRPDHLPHYQRWLNDFGVIRTLMRPPAPMTTEQTQSWVARHTGDEHSTAFTIYEASGRRPIGNTALINVDSRNRSAMFAILIGDADNRGHGYGTEATRLMLDYAFTARGFHSVWLVVAEYNHAGRRAYEKAGFQEVGRRREACWMGGRYWDEITMDCLATEFTSSLLARTSARDEPR